MATKDDDDKQQPARASAKKERGTDEIGRRSPDSDSSKRDDRFRRTFRLNKAELVDVEKQVHEANRHVVEREAINHGLSPELGKATFDGADDVEGYPDLLDLRYSVAVTDGRDSQES